MNRCRNHGASVEPPCVGDLEQTLDVLLSALIDYRRQRQPSSSLTFYSLQTLLAAPEAVLRARGWINVPIDLAFKHAVRDVLKLITPQVTNSGLGALIERVAAADAASYERQGVRRTAHMRRRHLDELKACWRAVFV